MSFMQFKEGDRILGRWDGGRHWFAGRVHSFSGDSVAIQYDDGTSEIRPVNDVRSMNWAEGTPVEARWSGNGEWYPGRIQQIAPDGASYDILFDDGDREWVSSGCCRTTG